MNADSLSVAIVNTNDSRGGATKVARRIMELANERGCRAWLAVRARQTDSPNVVRLRARENTALDSLSDALLRRVETLAEKTGLRVFEDGLMRTLWPDHYYNGTGKHRLAGPRQLLDALPQTPSLINFHNLHPPYFDLRAFPRLSREFPLVLAMHDMWLMTGHCGYAIECARWRTGCGSCPHLDRYLSAPRDGSARNLRLRARLLARSRVYYVTPSKWLMSLLEESPIGKSAAAMKIIPYGIDLTVFCPGDRAQARAELGIPGEAFVVLFVGNRVKDSEFKDYDTARSTFERLAAQHPAQAFHFICLGQDAPTERIGPSEVWFRYAHGAAEMAKYYRAADVNLHTAVADTFPNSVIEAMACGLPVVATGVDGIPDQVDDGRTGLLAAAKDAPGLAQRVGRLLEDPQMAAAMGREAARTARERYDENRMIGDYLDFYRWVIDDWRGRRGAGEG